MKRCLSLLLLCALTLLLFGCVTSPTAIKVNGVSVDAAEVAFYLRYNQSAGSLEAVKAAALDQISTAELIRQKCKEMKLSLTKEQKATLKQEKEALINQLGGKAAYLEYLNASLLTDRGYDKFQENALYYQLLYNAVHEKNKDIYTGEYLGQFFTGNYLAIRYIAVSRLDNDGNPLSESADAAQKIKAEQALNEMLANNADLDAILEKYNEDPEMMGGSEPLVLSRNEAEQEYPFLLPAFELEPGDFDGIYTTDTGYYIFIRSALSANYYSEHAEEIYYNAVDSTFSAQIKDWKEKSRITTTRVFDQMTLENLADYLK